MILRGVTDIGLVIAVRLNASACAFAQNKMLEFNRRARLFYVAKQTPDGATRYDSKIEKL